MLDYEILKIIWWALIVVLLIGFAIADGFDMGVGILLPFAAREDIERRQTLNVLAPHWDGNQVWFITAGGAVFAAWPVVYSVAFSGFYWALLLVLFAMFFRPVGFEYRSKIDSPKWRSTWDWALFAGSFVPVLVFGVAFGNLFQGAPIELDEFVRLNYEGNLFGLLNPFAILCGLVSVTLLAMHGGTYLQLRTDGEVEARSQKFTQWAALGFIITFALAGVWLAFGIDAYQVKTMGDINAAMVISQKTVVHEGSWLANYSAFPALIAAPVLGFAGAALALLLARGGRPGWAFISSSLAIAGTIVTAAGCLFPFILPSSLDPKSSLLVWDATSSHLTLHIMFIAAVIFVPIILIYTFWCYWKLWGKVRKQAILDNPMGHY
ncbi:MAG: cytochrome d ubiquinol oxidase subunit II [Gammaproteobacteria bacterium]|nr:MAG: cytochrome d ubiquinol oxidase subunit II [Gammaproteobacteria bacterium]